MRYHPLSEADRSAMLAAIGVSSIEALYADAPPATLLKAPLDLPNGKSELDVERFFARLAARNMPASRAPFLSATAPISITSPRASIISFNARNS